MLKIYFVVLSLNCKGFMSINFVDFSDLKEKLVLEGLREALLAVTSG